jgi:hypothetical protein
MPFGRNTILVVTLAALGAGCAVNTVSVNSPLAGLSCVDDSVDCITKRKTTLNYLTNDPTRSWIRQRPTPQAYASGVRLFAFKKKKKELTCAELKIGRSEADAASKVLRGSGAKSLSPAQVSRGTILATEVSRDLRREMRRRCKGKA